MNRETVRSRIQQIGIIPAVRVSTAADAIFAAETVAASGIPIVEMTMTVPGAVDVIRQLTAKNPDLLVGGGTVLDLDTARRCLDAGAQFLTSPGLTLDIVEFALKHDTVVFPGALTPTEIILAWKAGADFVKVFPSSLLGGANYVRALKSPFPQIPLIAAGGVNQQTVGDFILAGAVAVGIGRELIPAEAVKRRQPDWIWELAGRFLKIVAETRAQMSS
jgi:2-dehydro-3-deoxyphosphogluconate aldolase/(4S)-4-hydroxy-2-oxoglutarate aldolase